MIVHHSHRLHEGVANSGADELESAFKEVFAHGIGFRCARWDFFVGTPAIPDGLTANKTPDVLIESAELLLDCKERLCVLDRSIDF